RRQRDRDPSDLRARRLRRRADPRAARPRRAPARTDGRAVAAAVSVQPSARAPQASASAGGPPVGMALHGRAARVLGSAPACERPGAGRSSAQLLALLATLVLVAPCAGRSDSRTREDGMQTPPRPLSSGHAPVNGIRMYYEVHGRTDGVPLVLLHGGGSTIDVTFGRVLPILARSRRVIAVEEQGQIGRA